MRIYKFYTPSCGQCSVVGRLLTNSKLPFISVNCEEDNPLMEKYHIAHVPTVIVEYDDGSIKRLNNILEVKQWLSHNTAT